MIIQFIPHYPPTVCDGTAELCLCFKKPKTFQQVAPRAAKDSRRTGHSILKPTRLNLQCPQCSCFKKLKTFQQGAASAAKDQHPQNNGAGPSVSSSPRRSGYARNG